MSGGNLLSDAAAAKLVKLFRDNERRIVNLERRLATFGTRRKSPTWFSEDHGWGRITGTLSALGSQTCRVWRDVSGTMTDTERDITVYDRLLESGETLTDKWRVRWQRDVTTGIYYVIGAACSADTSATVWGT